MAELWFPLSLYWLALAWITREHSRHGQVDYPLWSQPLDSDCGQGLVGQETIVGAVLQVQVGGIGWRKL